MFSSWIDNKINEEHQPGVRTLFASGKYNSKKQNKTKTSSCLVLQRAALKCRKETEVLCVSRLSETASGTVPDASALRRRYGIFAC